jgi:hypothetical protein
MWASPFSRSRFSSWTIDGKVFDHNVLIRLGGKVAKRNVLIWVRLS